MSAQAARASVRAASVSARAARAWIQGVRTVLDNRRGPLGGGLHGQDGAAADDLRIGVLQVGVVDLTGGSGRVSARRAHSAHRVRVSAVQCMLHSQTIFSRQSAVSRGAVSPAGGQGTGRFAVHAAVCLDLYLYTQDRFSMSRTELRAQAAVCLDLYLYTQDQAVG